jgi:hypothetical protein
MRPHVSAETLARYRQGDLSPRQSSRIGAHLSGCARCSELNEDLGGVTTLLASVHPPPIPHDLTSRIQSALASEAAQRAAQRVAMPAGSEAAAAAGGGAAGPGSPAGARGPRGRLAPAGPRRRGRLARLPSMSGPRFALSAVAAAAAVVILGVGVFEIVQSGSSPTSSTAAGSSAAAGSAPATRGPALQYRRSGQQASVTPVSADTNFTAGRLSAQVASAMTKYSPGGTVAGPMAGPATHSAQVPGARAKFGNRLLAVLQGCVNRIAAGDLVVLVELARYQGSPATIIVTEVPDITPRQVWVVGTGCSASRSDVLRHSELSVG